MGVHTTSDIGGKGTLWQLALTRSGAMFSAVSPVRSKRDRSRRHHKRTRGRRSAPSASQSRPRPDRSSVK